MVRGISMSSVMFPGSRAEKGDALCPCSARTPTTTLHRRRLHRPRDNPARQSQQLHFTGWGPDLAPRCPEQSQGSPSGRPMGEMGLALARDELLHLSSIFLSLYMKSFHQKRFHRKDLATEYGNSLNFCVPRRCFTCYRTFKHTDFSGGDTNAEESLSHWVCMHMSLAKPVSKLHFKIQNDFTFFFFNLTCRFSGKIFQWALVAIKIASMTMLHGATEGAGPWPTVCAGGEGSQLGQCLFPSTNGNGYAHTAFLVQHFPPAEKGITYFSSLLVTFVHKTIYSVPSSSLMQHLSL